MNTFDAGDVTLHLADSVSEMSDTIRHNVVGDFHVVAYATWDNFWEASYPFQCGMANGELNLASQSCMGILDRNDDGSPCITDEMGEFAAQARSDINSAHPDFVEAVSYALDKVKSFIDEPEEYSWCNPFSGPTSLEYAGFHPANMAEVIEAVAAWALHGIPLWLTKGHGLEQVAGKVWEFSRNMSWSDSPYAIPLCNVSRTRGTEQFAIGDASDADVAWLPDNGAMENMASDLAKCQTYADKVRVVERYIDGVLDDYNAWLRGDVFKVTVEVFDEWGVAVTADIPGVADLTTWGILGDTYAGEEVQRIFGKACALTRKFHDWQIRTACGAQVEMEL